MQYNGVFTVCGLLSHFVHTYSNLRGSLKTTACSEQEFRKSKCLGFGKYTIPCYVWTSNCQVRHPLSDFVPSLLLSL